MEDKKEINNIMPKKTSIIYDQSNNKIKVKLNNEKKKFLFCKNLMKLMFSNIGLVLLVALYSCLGAFMFKILEQHEELRLCEEGKNKITKEIQNLKENITRYVLYNLTTNDFNNDVIEEDYKIGYDYYTGMERNLAIPNISQLNEIKDSEENEPIRVMLKNFRDFVLQIEFKYKYNGQNCVDNSKWNFFSALLFSITVIATVGYGHVTPVTWEGQIVCICYATIGIPMFLLCLANLSGAFGDIFKFIYSKLNEINFCERKKLERRTRPRADTCASLGITKLEILLNENRTNSEKHSIQNNELIIKPYEDDDDDESEDSEEYYYEDGQNVRIPSLLVLLVIAFYVGCGTYLFITFENWKPVQSVYFIYTSLTTIGFGDFVPGQKKEDPNSNLKHIAICFYCLFGMSLLGMGFSLLQGAVKRTIRKLVSKVKKCFNQLIQRKDKIIATEADRERERQEILQKLKLLQNYENMLSTRRRKV